MSLRHTRQPQEHPLWRGGDICELYAFSQQHLIIGSRHYIFVFSYLVLLTTGVARSGQRQVPFLKPHLVTVTDTRPTSRKYVVNVFPKDITSWSGQDSNPGPSAPDPDALTTRPQRHPILSIATKPMIIFPNI